ncbi:hypothetical protein HDC90_004031 [Pedobacter sp. AK013]|uniref:DUF6252 family protein n=1 Tax=Pedobacter sp. AK013 TaxID=2723071 RepID=UPI00160F8F9B|nr:DUF6252 family protein [Pedobacter sp. AK013]MBB6239378.1 hypothetical protein [Pedobacter sp. AK013]
MLVKVPFKLSLLALVCLLITSSCKKEIDYHQEWDLSTMSAKVDGALLQCTLTTAQVYEVGGKISAQISGFKGTTAFTLVMSDFKGVGTYALSDNNFATYLTGTSFSQDAYIGSTSGTIKITSYLSDKYIKGTFEFKGENLSTSTSKTISEGQFMISLVPVKLPETNNSTNNLSAKVDGTTIGFTGEATSINTPIIGNLLTIVTINGDKRMILSVIDYKGVGTYDLVTDGVGSYMKDQTPTGSFTATSGTLVITSEVGGKLKGTFSFKAPNENTTINTSVTVTDGVFDLPFSKK